MTPIGFRDVCDVIEKNFTEYIKSKYGEDKEIHKATQTEPQTYIEWTSTILPDASVMFPETTIVIGCICINTDSHGVESFKIYWGKKSNVVIDIFINTSHRFDWSPNRKGSIYPSQLISDIIYDLKLIEDDVYDSIPVKICRLARKFLFMHRQPYDDTLPNFVIECKHSVSGERIFASLSYYDKFKFIISKKTEPIPYVRVCEVIYDYRNHEVYIYEKDRRDQGIIIDKEGIKFLNRGLGGNRSRYDFMNFMAKLKELLLDVKIITEPTRIDVSKSYSPDNITIPIEEAEKHTIKLPELRCVKPIKVIKSITVDQDNYEVIVKWSDDTETHGTTLCDLNDPVDVSVAMCIAREYFGSLVEMHKQIEKMTKDVQNND